MKNFIFFFFCLLSIVFQASAQNMIVKKASALDTVIVRTPKILQWRFLGSTTVPLLDCTNATLTKSYLDQKGISDLPVADSIWHLYDGRDTIKACTNEGFNVGWEVLVANPLSTITDTILTPEFLLGFDYQPYLKQKQTWYNESKDTLYHIYRLYMPNDWNYFDPKFKKAIFFKLRFVNSTYQEDIPYISFAIVTRSPKHLLDGYIVGNNLLPDNVGFSDEFLRKDSTTIWFPNKETQHCNIGMSKRLNKFKLQDYIKDSIGSDLKFELLSMTKDSSEFYLSEDGIINAIFDTDSLKSHGLDIKVRILNPYISRVFKWNFNYPWENWRNLNGAAASADTFTVNGEFRVYTSTIVPYTKPSDAIDIAFEDTTLNPIKIRSLNRTDFNPSVPYISPGDSVFAIAKAMYKCTAQAIYQTDTVFVNTIKPISAMKSGRLKNSPYESPIQYTTKATTLVLEPRSLNIKVTKKTGIEVPTIKPTVYRTVIIDKVTVVTYVDDPKFVGEEFKPIINSFGIQIVGYAGVYSLNDMKGSNVASGSIKEGENINISSLSSGIYFLRIVENGSPKVIKFFK